MQNMYSQHFLDKADTLNKPRIITVSTLVGAGWSGSIVGLYSVWYKGYPKSKFHSFDDSKEWLQMDKMGHALTAYSIADKIATTYRWSGLDRNKSAFIGAGVGFGYQLTLEVLDGMSSQWGFSWSDILANTTGTALFLGQELGFREQIFKPKFSFSPSPYAKYRPNMLGSNFAQQLLKDYNGQTYWLSFSPFAFSKNANAPKWLCLSLGYSIKGKLHGENNTYTVANQTFHAQREFVLSLDIDVSKFHFKRKWPRILLSPFNIIKIPFPAVVFSTNGAIQGHWLYF
jgi:hypothetical protein